MSSFHLSNAFWSWTKSFVFCEQRAFELSKLLSIQTLTLRANLARGDFSGDHLLELFRLVWQLHICLHSLNTYFEQLDVYSSSDHMSTVEKTKTLAKHVATIYSWDHQLFTPYLYLFQAIHSLCSYFFFCKQFVKGLAQPWTLFRRF